MTIGEALRARADELERAGVDSPHLDAELLVAHALGLSRADLYARTEHVLTRAEAARTRELVERRCRREPLAYVLGEWGFRRLTLRTDPRALVPRPETEVLVERALVRIADVKRPHIVDVGVGGGAIALALADERPDAHVTATEVSTDALALARENAERLGLEVELVRTSLVDGLAGPFDLVVSNPPYVFANEELPPELAYEPREALIEERQTERLLVEAQRVLRGWLLVETHSERSHEIAALARDAGYSDVAVTRDLAGRDRVVEAQWMP